MSMNRRSFLQSLAIGTAGTALFPSYAAAALTEQRLVILHTNDTHSRIDPFADGRNAGLGGVARRAALIKRIRQTNPNVLLLDSGDIFQGTPYFNFFKGELEFKAMSAMRYDVATLGNHDFDNGVDGLVAMLPHADFQFVSSNYEITEPTLKDHVQPYTVRRVGNLKVGIFGLGIDFAGLVLADLHKGVAYTDPILAAKRSVETLRNEGCHLIICLSHMGYRYRGDRPSDSALAQEVPEIDLILGGHTHTFLDEPDAYTHPQAGTTLVNQVGFAGIRLGRIDVTFTPDGQAQQWQSASYMIDHHLDYA